MRQLKNITLSSVAESIIALVLTIVVLQSIFEKDSSKGSKVTSNIRRPMPRPQKHRHVPIMRILEKIDWHDKNLIRKEQNRTGNGELGAPANLTSHRAPEDVEKIWKTHGFNAILSDDISLERSLPDVRHPE